MYCATGQAGPLPATFTCPATYPPNSLPTGGGQLCYLAFADCVGGPNACNDTVPCVQDPATCATGAAGPTANSFFCPADMPPNSLPNGGGQLCYRTVDDCLNGPNYCDATTCIANTATCSSGIVGPSPDLNTFCQYDQPQTQLATPATPGSLPNAAGGNCYYSQADCLIGPNACDDPSAECLPDYTTCSTGQAGPTSAWYFCQKDLPVGSAADGGGELCYSTASDCANGPNACGPDTPCAPDPATCSTGPAGPAPTNWYCALDTPVGAASGVAALPSGSGVLCWDSVADCLQGPNACAAAAAGCVRSNATARLCSTGLAASNPVGSKVACLMDFPAGAAANAAGKWCYDTPGNCLNGTNACNASAPCVKAPAAVCATAGAGGANPYFCAYDYPVDVAKGLSAAGGICYRSALDCMGGPNACNTSSLCQADATLAGPCKGASAPYQYYCPLNLPPGSGPVPSLTSSSGAGSVPHARLAAALVGAAILLFGSSPARVRA